MRAAAILGLGSSPKDLKPFQSDASVHWSIGTPTATEEADILLIFGGDGTIHRHLSQLVKLNVPVLVVPAGSGNDFARALGLRSVRDSLAAWRKFCAGNGNFRTIDLGTISPISHADEAHAPHYFCSVAGIGLDAEVARRANALPRWLRAHGGYALTLAPTIFRFAAFLMKISTSEKNGNWSTRSHRSTLLAAFANTSTYGGGMKIAPHAKMDDGQLDVCVIASVNPFKLAGLFPSVYFGKHLRLRAVSYFQSSRARVETEAPLEVYADGEFVCRTPVEIRVAPGALKVLVP
jgi:diacylglycerol kinase (ATP)